MFDVIALGELLVDFTGSGASPQGNPVYEANPGGAPCNVLAMLPMVILYLIFQKQFIEGIASTGGK